MMEISNIIPAISDDIREFVSKNEIKEVALLVEKNPELILDNPELIKLARSPCMVIFGFGYWKQRYTFKSWMH